MSGIHEKDIVLAAADNEDIGSWFSKHKKPKNSIAVTAHVVPNDKRKLLEDFIANIIPECYITSDNIAAQKVRSGLTESEIVNNKVPDTGNIMAGDFAEILTLFFLGSGKGEFARKVKKWQFKQDRMKPAPHSDVIILHCKDPENPSENDYVICAEAKSKALKNNTYRPIANAIKGYEADKTGRLARTLSWLREKAIENEDAASIAFVERFTKSNLGTSFRKNYRAVVVIDRALLDAELVEKLHIPPQNEEFEVVVLGVDDLKPLYETCFSRAVSELENE